MKLRAKGNKLKVEKVRGDRKKKKKNLPTKKQMKNIDLLHQHTTEALQAMEEEQKQSYSNTVSAWLILQYSKSLVNPIHYVPEQFSNTVSGLECSLQSLVYIIQYANSLDKIQIHVSSWFKLQYSKILDITLNQEKNAINLKH